MVARKPLTGTVAANVQEHGTGALNIDACRVGTTRPDVGRWPPNVLLDQDAAAEMDQQAGLRRSSYPGRPDQAAGYAGSAVTSAGTTYLPDKDAGRAYSDAGGASRFFPVFRYQAKAPSSERPRLPDGTAHPTVKPLELMRWLVRLVTPPGGLVLDLFAGTGTTGQACRLEGLRCVLIERDDRYVQLTLQRLSDPRGATLFDAERDA